MRRAFTDPVSAQIVTALQKPGYIKRVFAAVHTTWWVVWKGASVMKFWIVSVAAVLSLMAMTPL